MPDRDSDKTVAEASDSSPAGANEWPGLLLIPFASLRNRNFRLLWIGQLGQASAMWADQVARNWLTWQLTESATAIGLVNLFRALPLITLGLMGGVVADRFDKRKVLIVIQFWSITIYVATAVLLLTDSIRLWHVYLTAFLLGGGMALNQPVRTSFIPQLLEGRLLVNAISLNSIAINVSRLFGPAAIGFLIALANNNVGPAYIVASVVYVVVIVSTFMIDAPKMPQAVKKGASFFTDFIDGFKYMLFENRTILALIIIAMGPLAFAFSYINLLPVFVTNKLNMGPSIFGLLQSIAAVGALVGGFAMASLREVRHKGRIMLITGASYGVAVTAIGVLPFPVVAFGLVVIVGASQTIFRAANNGSLLELTPPGLQGRVISATFVDMVVQSLAALMAGAVTDQWGVGAGMAVLGGLCLTIVLAIWLGVPSIRKI